MHNAVIPAKAGIQASLNMGASYQMSALHPHPNPLPSAERGVTQRSPKAGTQRGVGGAWDGYGKRYTYRSALKLTRLC